VSILLTDDDAIRELNRQYRGIDSPTDVLSFAQDEGDDDFAAGVGENVLGDIVISVETARRQAKQSNKALEEEIDVLVAHGVLHLLGYDHAEPDDEKRMFDRQSEILEMTGAE